MTDIASRTCVVPVICDDRGRVLLVKMAPNRGVFPGQWALPGGGVEPGERIADALAREVREELGIELASAEPLAAIELPDMTADTLRSAIGL